MTRIHTSLRFVPEAPLKLRTRQECWNIIIEALTELLEEVGEEPGEIQPTTMLNANLGISSVDAIHLMILLEDRLEKPLSFEKLAVRDGEYVQDLSVGELLKFVGDSLGLPETAAPAPNKN
jgi:acyl carrier protein